MSKLEKGIYQCEVCYAKLKMRHGWFANMTRHCKAKHPDIYAEETLTFNRGKGQSVSKGSSRKIKSIKYKPVSIGGPWIKRYMIKIREGIYQCNICYAKLKMPHGLYGNMKRHFERKHPYVYAKETNVLEDEKELDISVNKGSSRNIVSMKYEPLSIGGPWIKRYIIKIREGVYQCNICYAKLKMPRGLYGNMKRHFEHKHPHVYAMETNVLKDKKQLDIDICDKRSSWVSKYMSKIQEGVYQCKICSTRLKICHRTFTSLKMHIIRKHPIIHAKETNNLNINYKEKHSNLLCEKLSKINEIAEAGAYEEIHAEQTIKSKNDNHSKFIEEVILVEECIVEEEGNVDLSNVAYVIENCEAASDTTNVESDTENDLLESVGPLSGCVTLIETKKSEKHNAQEDNDPLNEVHSEVVKVGYQCKYCHVILDGSTSEENLLEHIKEAHPEQVDFCSVQSIRDEQYRVVVITG